MCPIAVSVASPSWKVAAQIAIELADLIVSHPVAAAMFLKTVSN